jgi:DNA-binding CsgD family transcriptional regulator
MEAVLLHTEPDVLQPPPLQAAPRRPALLAELLRAHDAAGREAVVRDWLQGLGFDWLGWGRALASQGRLLPVSFCISHAPAEWVRRYFDQRFHEVDPRLREVLNSSLPCTWTIEELAGTEATHAQPARLRRFVDELAATGARSGVMLALPAAPGEERYVVSLGAGRAGSAWIDDALVGQVLTMALCLHELHMRYAEPPRPTARKAAARGLTPLQREILVRVAHGLPDKLIAAQLDLTLHNVDYHLRRLRQHFGVRNRVQLSQAAIEGGSVAAT